MGVMGPGAPRSSAANRRRLRLVIAAAALLLIVAAGVAAVRGGKHPGLPLPGAGKPARAGDPFAYIRARQRDFVQRAIAGTSHVLFTKSPGGVVATAARVAALRPLIDRVSAASGIDPTILEGIVFVESAGRSDVIAGSDPQAASGLTQILAQTAQGLLGMHVDLERSRRLTRRIYAAAAAGRERLVAALERQRARVDDRFAPAKALAGT